MTRSFLTLAAAGLLLSSCAYTGDPNQGGLFGWSQPMANDRIAAREQYLYELENENAYQRGRTSALKQEEARRQQELKRARGY